MDERRGLDKIQWATAHMPLCGQIAKEFAEARPLAGRRIAMSIHLEAKTARLAILLRDAGARVWVTGSNPLSTQDDVAAALAREEGVTVRARHGVSAEEYREHIHAVAGARPDLVLDDGGDLVAALHEGNPDGVVGGCEETTTGVLRLRRLAALKRLAFPMFAVNDTPMKRLFDNRHGTGQSVWDALMRSTNLLVAGKRVVIGGYGECGRGIADRARGLGAHVTVCEVDPVKALEAVMCGLTVAPMVEAIRHADIVVTATGDVDVVSADALAAARDGVLLANAGHFNVEVNLAALSAMATSRRFVRPGVEEVTFADGRRVFLLAEGRLVNLALGDGHPVEIMDLSFALQALTLRHIAASAPLPPGVYDVPESVDRDVAGRKLAALGLRIDSLTPGQREYLGMGVDVGTPRDGGTMRARRGES
ncbi:MAG: adenosylhomocysteinase [Candidatus Bipolaricaulota bacterium]